MAEHTVSAAPTVEDAPESKERERKRREWALLERLATGQTAHGFNLYGECGSCGATVKDWRAHLHEVKDFDASRDDGPTVRLAYRDACSVCGGSVVEVRAEPRRGHRGATR